MKNTLALATSLSLILVLIVSTAQAANSCRSLVEQLQLVDYASGAVKAGRPREAAKPVETARRPEPTRPAKKDMVNTLIDAHLGGIPESGAFTREGVALEGQFKPQIARSDDVIKTINSTGKAVVYDGVKYIEFPNSTAMSTVDPVTGNQREFILTRGVKPYVEKMNSETGSISPQGYVSDVLLFERVSGQYVFRHRILASKEDAKFFFEDPRISVIHDAGKTHYFLSGTDYSSHRPDSTDPDVMNRYVELKIDGRGLPVAVEVDPQTGKPAFSNMSPAPKRTDDVWAFVDAKNGTIAQNEAGEIVIRTRMRPDFGNPIVKAMAGDKHWQYAEQVFVFKNWQAFKDYNWNDALVDLFGKRGLLPTESTEGPSLSKIIILDTDLTENLTSSDPNLKVEVRSAEHPDAKGKGLGPGTRPVRIQRKGNQLFTSDGPGAPEHFAGDIPENRLNDFPIVDGGVTYLTFDHEIRYVKQKVNGQTLMRRHYSASLKFFDSTLTNIIFYRPDAIQPKTKHELGFNSGITDLLHVYPMGFAIAKSGNSSVVRVYAGASDAHTTIYDFNILRLMLEMKK